MSTHKDQVELLVRLPSSLRERLKKVAKKNKRSANNEAVYAIEKHIEAQEKEDAV